MYRYHPENIGEFTEVDYGRYFTYRRTSNPWALQQGLSHEIDMIDGGVRFGNVKKTVAYIATDEDESGNAVLEKWSIKKHINYEKA